VKPDSIAANYLIESQSGVGNIQASINRIKALISACGSNMHNVQLYYHHRVLRYTIIYTEQCIWIKLYTNGSIQTDVPAFKVETGTPLFKFFEDDINLFMKQADERES
jgi:hypothetical protein